MAWRAPRIQACPHVSRCPGDAREAALSPDGPGNCVSVETEGPGEGSGAARAGVTMVNSPPGQVPPGQ